jgi:DNA-binding GntR family transcriptional regulator
MANGTDAHDPTKYKRLAAVLRGQIQDGTIAVGGQVSITQLAAENRWSRQTCARALGILMDEGLLARYKGLGYYVIGRPRE